MSDPIPSTQTLFFNGINGDDGNYDLPPMTGDELAKFIRGESAPENLDELKARHERSKQEFFGVIEGVDPKNLSAAGWGVVFAHDADPAVEEALSELLTLRKQQTGDLFRIYKGGNGYRVGKDTKNSFLSRQGAGPGPVDPAKVPYYLLIVGSPDKIPYRFQYQLDVQHAVGRIHFDSLQEYANYAHGVVAAETGGLALKRTAAFWGPANPDDPATQLSSQELLEPLRQKYQLVARDWQIRSHIGGDATKEQLGRLLGGDETPALLFTASHGMAFPLGSNRQLPHQGALLCQEWPGPKQWQAAIPQEHYFAGDDLTAASQLHGMIALFFACFGAGTPLHDEFSKQAFQQRKQIAPVDFLAQLPTRMLSHANGGALAVVGHVDRAWGYSFVWPQAGGQTAVFGSAFQALIDGAPVGYATEYFNERYAELSTELTVQLENLDFGAPVSPYEIAGLWTANNDARGYAILGDPAVRLPLVAAGAPVQERAILIMPSVADVRASAAPMTGVASAAQPASSTLSGGANFSAVDESQPAGGAPSAAGVTVKTVVAGAAAATTTFDLHGITTALSEQAASDKNLLRYHQGMVEQAIRLHLANAYPGSVEIEL
jgi:hypothetical protein